MLANFQNNNSGEYNLGDRGETLPAQGVQSTLDHFDEGHYSWRSAVQNKRYKNKSNKMMNLKPA